MSLNTKINRDNIFYYKTGVRLEYHTTTLNELDRDYDSGAEIRYVSANSLPTGVLGTYTPSTHVIRIANNLSGREHDFVRAHESQHAQGVVDETKTDILAANKVGFNLRPIGYRPLPR